MSEEPVSIIRELIRNIRETRFKSFDGETVAQAKLRIADVVGCLISGANAPGCAMMVDMVRGWGGNTESTILMHGGKAPAHDAAMVNSIMCRSFDFEPVEAHVHGRNIPSHISGTTVPVALALGEWRNATGEELITALIAGDDLASRILAASRFSFDSGWDTTGTVNLFGATAIAGRLLKLDDAQMQNAMGIALNQIAGSFQNIYDAALSFKLPMGLSARAAVFSAEVAARGYTGIKDPLTSRHGYFRLYGQGYDPEVLTLNLGREYFSDRTFKPYPACRSTHGAIECALQIAHRQHIDIGEIREVVVGVTEITTRMFVSRPFGNEEVTQPRATFSLQYNVANALVRKAIRLEHFTEEYIRDKAVVDLARKVKIVAKIPPDKPLATVLEVFMKSGSKLSTSVDVPKGDGISTPLTRQEIEDKFMQNAAFSKRISEKQGKRVLEMIGALEDLGDVAALIREIH